jgi:hypothetical protein
MEAHSIMQQVDWEAGRGIGFLPALGRLVHIDGTPESVLRREDRGDPDPRVDQPVEIALAATVHPRLIGHQADPAVADQFQAVGQQDFDAGSHGWRRGSGAGPEFGGGTGIARAPDPAPPQPK